MAETQTCKMSSVPVQQVATGVYAYLPLGWRSLRKLEEIVREEFDRIGGQELMMPALQARAVLRGRDYVSGEDVEALAPYVFGHRLELAPGVLALVNERLAKRFEGPTMMVRTDSNVYSKGVVIGKVRQGLRVPVLATQNAISLIRFRDSLGTDLVGWIPSSALEARL